MLLRRRRLLRRGARRVGLQDLGQIGAAMPQLVGAVGLEQDRHRALVGRPVGRLRGRLDHLPFRVARELACARGQIRGLARLHDEGARLARLRRLRRIGAGSLGQDVGDRVARHLLALRDLGLGGRLELLDGRLVRVRPCLRGFLRTRGCDLRIGALRDGGGALLLDRRVRARAAVGFHLAVVALALGARLAVAEGLLLRRLRVERLLAVELGLGDLVVALQGRVLERVALQALEVLVEAGLLHATRLGRLVVVGVRGGLLRGVSARERGGLVARHEVGLVSGQGCQDALAGGLVDCDGGGGLGGGAGRLDGRAEVLRLHHPLRMVVALDLLERPHERVREARDVGPLRAEVRQGAHERLRVRLRARARLRVHLLGGQDRERVDAGDGVLLDRLAAGRDRRLDGAARELLRHGAEAPGGSALRQERGLLRLRHQSPIPRIGLIFFGFLGAGNAGGACVSARPR